MNPPENPQLANTVEAIAAKTIAYMNGWDDEQRHQFLVELKAVFCHHCGSRHPTTGRGQCQCWNDE